MKNWVVGTFAACMAGTAQAEVNCGDPSVAMTRYLEASVERSAGTVYELTASSKRGELQDFLSKYHEAYSSPQVFREFFSQNTDTKHEVLSNDGKVSRFYVTAEIPDFYSVAMSRAEQGIRLDTRADWADLVEVMRVDGFETVINQEEFYLVCEDQQWRVLEPLPF